MKGKPLSLTEAERTVRRKKLNKKTIKSVFSYYIILIIFNTNIVSILFALFPTISAYAPKFNAFSSASHTDIFLQRNSFTTIWYPCCGAVALKVTAYNTVVKGDENKKQSRMHSTFWLFYDTVGFCVIFFLWTLWGSKGKN